MRRDALDGHILKVTRVPGDPVNGRKKTSTEASCTCGDWSERRISQAPSRGGWTSALQAHRNHLTDVISRDAALTVARARAEWRDWQPGDGTCYRVRIINITGGPDHSDRILLINCVGRTWAFQYVTAAYRRDLIRAIRQKRSAPIDLWSAAWPLLRAEGAL